MRGRLGVDIGERDALVVLINGLGGDGAFDDFAEETTHNGSSVQDVVEIEDNLRETVVHPTAEEGLHTSEAK